jgi:hypothetical protein
MKTEVIGWRGDFIHLKDSKGEFRITYRTLRSKQKVNETHESWDNLYTVSVTVLGRRVRRTFIRELLAGEFTGSYCYRSHDCCEDASWEAHFSNVVHTKRNEYRIMQHFHINSRTTLNTNERRTP